MMVVLLVMMIHHYCRIERLLAAYVCNIFLLALWLVFFRHFSLSPEHYHSADTAH
jgi:hypothetical protein